MEMLAFSYLVCEVFQTKAGALLLFCLVRAKMRSAPGSDGTVGTGAETAPVSCSCYCAAEPKARTARTLPCMNRNRRTGATLLRPKHLTSRDHSKHRWPQAHANEERPGRPTTIRAKIIS